MRVAVKRRRKREAGFRASLYLEFPRLLVAPYRARRAFYESRVTRFKRRAPLDLEGERLRKAAPRAGGIIDMEFN
jgi:hypothetical protein